MTRPLTQLEARATICLALGFNRKECAWALGVGKTRLRTLKLLAIRKLKQGARIY